MNTSALIYDDFLHGFIMGWSGCHGKNPEEPED